MNVAVCCVCVCCQMLHLCLCSAVLLNFCVLYVCCSVGVCGGVHVCVCVCVCQYAQVHLCVFIMMWLSLCLCWHVSVRVCLWLFFWWGWRGGGGSVWSVYVSVHTYVTPLGHWKALDHWFCMPHFQLFRFALWFTGASYGGGSELFYSQFELHLRHQKINQIVLLEVRGSFKARNSHINMVFVYLQHRYIVPACLWEITVFINLVLKGV